MADMSINSLKANLTNPAREYLWEVIFSNPKGGDTETLLLRCQSTTIPGRSIGTIPVAYKGTGGVVYAGKLKFSHTWDCTFIEGEDRLMWNAFYDWAKSIIDEQTGMGSISIKTDIHLRLLNTDGTAPLSIVLVGCFLSDQKDIAISYASEKEMTISTTWSYDYWTKK